MAQLIYMDAWLIENYPTAIWQTSDKREARVSHIGPDFYFSGSPKKFIAQVSHCITPLSNNEVTNPPSLVRHSSWTNLLCAIQQWNATLYKRFENPGVYLRSSNEG